MALLKTTPKYFNTYEGAYNVLSRDNPLFNDDDWTEMSKKGDLDMYIALMANRDKITDINQFYKDYNYEFADSKTRVAALYNEIFSNKSNTDEKREKYKTNEQGRVEVDDKGNPVIETFTASDYEYNKSLILAHNQENYRKYLMQQEQERKDSMNGFIKHLATIGSIATEAVIGATSQVDNILNAVAAVGAGIGAIFTDENSADAVVKTINSDTFRLFESLGIQDALLDFERNYTYMRDLDGDYSGFGNIVGNVSNTLGQMIPSMLVGKGVGAGMSAIGGSAAGAATAAQITSSLVFYTGVTDANIRDMYRTFAEQNVSVPNGLILTNAMLKSALQAAIEIGVGRWLGGSNIDSIVFGRKAASSTAATLGKSGFNRLFHDFVTEGLEEVVQDTFDWLVDTGFSLVVNENFGKINNLTWQALMDSFYIGGIASFAGSAMQILTTKNVETSNIKTDKDGKTITYEKDIIAKHDIKYKQDVLNDKGEVLHKKGDIQYKKGKVIHQTGDPKFKKLNKLQSWEYGLNMQSFLKNFNTLQSELDENVKEYTTNTNKGKQYATAFTEMYAAFRMLGSIYNSIGPERFDAANDILTEITKKINDGKFDADSLKRASENLKQYLQDMDAKAAQNALTKLEEARITKVHQNISRDTNLEDTDIDDATKHTVETMITQDNEIDNILLTDGTNIVKQGKIVFIPMNYAEKADAGTIFSTIAEQDLVTEIVQGKYRGLPLDRLTQLYKEVSGEDDATVEKAVLNLLFNDSFFKIVLRSANKDTFKFVSSLYDMINELPGKNLREAKFKQKVETTVKNMKISMSEYLINQPFADEKLSMFTDTERKYIARMRYCKDLYNRVINNNKKLSANDWTVLENRVNYLKIEQKEKDTILENLHSDKKDVRSAAMNRIANAYKGVFTSLYDGITYMPDTSIPNRMFNVFLQQEGLTLQTFVDTAVNENVRQAVITEFGDFNKDTLLKFRNSQFGRMCNDQYKFYFTDNNLPAIEETETHTQVGYTAYHSQAEQTLQPTHLDERTVIETTSKHNYLVRELLDRKLLDSEGGKATAWYLSIDDVIMEPTLLNSTIRNDIIDEYGVLTPENAFLYLRDYFLEHSSTSSTKLMTVVALRDGSYAFASVRNMTTSLNKDLQNGDKLRARLNQNKSGVISLTQVVQDKYLYGRLENTLIKIVNDDTTGSYDMSTNTIRIGKSVVDKGGDKLIFTLLHEFQHAIQAENRMNIGMNSNWIHTKTLNSGTLKAIIKDVRKHRPQLFKDITEGSDAEKQIVNDFVYFSSGESTALGLDASTMIDFYPTLVYDTNKGTMVQFPWGTSYNITSKIPMSLVTLTKDLEVEFASNEEYKKYYNIAKVVANELRDFTHRQATTDLTKYPTLYSIFKNDTDTFNDTIYKLCTFITNNDEVDALLKFAEIYLTQNKASRVKYDTIDYLHTLVSIYTAATTKSNDVTVRSTKSLTDLRALYNETSQDVAVNDLANKIFDKCEELARWTGINIEFTSLLNRAQAVINLLTCHQPTSIGGVYVPYKHIYYHTNKSNNYEPLPSTILHELLHYITSEILRNTDFNTTVGSLYERCNENATPPKYQGFKNVREFVAEFVNPDFRAEIRQISQTTNLSASSLEEIRLKTKRDDINTIYDAYVALVETLLNVDTFEIYLNKKKLAQFNAYPRILNVLEKNQGKFVPYIYSQEKSNGEIYDTVYDINTRELLYSEKSIGANLELQYLDDVVRLINNDTSEVLAEFSKYTIFDTELDEIRMDLANTTNTDAEQRMLNALDTEIRQMLEKNKPFDVIRSTIEQKYKFVPTELIDKAFANVPKSNLMTLNDESKGQRIQKTVKPRQDRTYHELTEGENIIYNTTGKGDWISKVPKLDSRGNIKRNSAGHILYKYTYKKNRQISNTEAKGTNLEKFGYTGKYKVAQLSNELKHFIIHANENIDAKLWNKVKDRTISKDVIMDYLRDAKSIDKRTFDLINDSYFHNSDISTFDELIDYVDNKTSKYYAIGAVLKQLHLTDAYLSNTNPKLYDKLLEYIQQNVQLSNIYNRVNENYYNTDTEISKKNLRVLWLRYFDGSIAQGSYIASIAKIGAFAKWQVTGEGGSGKTISLDTSIGDGDMTAAEKIPDLRASAAFDQAFYNMERTNKIRLIMEIKGRPYMQSLIRKCIAEDVAAYKTQEKIATLYQMSDTAFQTQYKKIIASLPDEQLNKVMKTIALAEAADINLNKLNDTQADELIKTADELIPNERPPRAIANNIYGLIRTIKKNLSTKDISRFVKDNGDIFDKNLNIKSEVIHNKDTHGRPIYKDADTLNSLWERLKSLSQDVRDGAYRSKKALTLKKKMDKIIADLQAENARLITQLANGKTTKVMRYEVADEVITVETAKEIPAALKRLLETDFTKTAKSQVKYVTDGDERHIVTSLKTFIENNAALLNVLTQQDVDEIIDFYSNSSIMPGTNKARQYTAIQMFTLGYLYKGNKIGQFVLTEEQRKFVYDRLATMSSFAHQASANWREVLKMIDPAKIIIQSIGKANDVEFSTEDIDRLLHAADSGDINKIMVAKDTMYKHAQEQFKAKKTSFLEKLVKIERLCMLSSPSTWVRNWTSNVLVTAGNRTAEQIGKGVTTVIEKMFPNKKWQYDKQYKITGTKITSEVESFVNKNFVENKLLDLLAEGSTKYDTRVSKQKEMDETGSFALLLTNAVKDKLFQSTQFNAEWLQKWSDFTMKVLSDSKFVNKAALRYFKAMLVEDNTDLTNPHSKDVINTFAEAYKLAAYDYMHKKNFLHKMENILKPIHGGAWYAMYKQVFPFAGSSMNWFVEALNYTPVGLAKAIVNFVKLENTIDKMDAARQKDASALSSRFATYLTKRNIGKGVIGSVGTIIGALLVAFGVAGLDEEDNKYKLCITAGNDKVYIDISDIFGTSGLLWGITLASSIKDGADFGAIVSDTLDTMFRDTMFSDIFNSFRWSDSFGEWLSTQPFSILDMFIPGFLKLFSSISMKYNVKYSSGILGHFEKLAVKALPGLVYAFPKYHDPYTGENQVRYKNWFFTQLANKLLPFKIYPYNVSTAEKEAISVGLRKKPLRGTYEIDGKKVNLNAKTIAKLNEYYGTLNKNELNKLISNKKTYKVWDDKKNKYVEIKYNAMTDEQKKTVIDRIMNDNGTKSKIYILTSTNKYKYYATENEYKELRSMGIRHNIFIKNNKYEGFVEV